MKRTRDSLPITYREYKFTDDFPFLLMHGNQISSQIDFIHFHNCIEIALLEKGTMIWNLENKIYQLTPGTICFLPPFFTHASFFPPQQTEELLCHYIFFNPEKLLAPLYPNGLPQDFFWYRYADFSKILHGDTFLQEKILLQAIVEEFSTRKNYSHTIVTGLILSLMVQLYRHHHDCPTATAKAANAIPQLFPAIACMDKKFADSVDIEMLAGLCKLSPAQFSRIFQACFHQTPKQYLHAVRIRKACQLLTSTEDTILDIALRTGYSSLSSFNRHFLKLMGRSPLAFRNEKRAIVKNEWKYAPYQSENNLILPADSHLTL